VGRDMYGIYGKIREVKEVMGVDEILNMYNRNLASVLEEDLTWNGVEELMGNLP